MRFSPRIGRHCNAMAPKPIVTFVSARQSGVMENLPRKAAELALKNGSSATTSCLKSVKGTAAPLRFFHSSCYCFSSINVETLPVCLLSTTVVIFFPSGETATFSTL